MRRPFCCDAIAQVCREDEKAALNARIEYLEMLLEKSSRDIDAFQESYCKIQRELQGQIMALKVENIELEEFKTNVTSASFCNLVTSMTLDSSELEELLQLCWDCVDIEAKVQGLREEFIQRRSTPEK